MHLFIIHAISAHFDPNNRYSDGAYGLTDNQYDRGTFDLETWTCELHVYPALKSDRSMLAQQCTFEKTSRWLSLALFLFSTAIVGATMWVLATEKSLVQALKVRRQSWDSDYGVEIPSIHPQ